MVTFSQGSKSALRRHGKFVVIIRAGSRIGYLFDSAENLRNERNMISNSKGIFMKAIRRLSLCAIALLLPALAGCGGSPARESTGEYFDDMIITTKVDTQ